MLQSSLILASAFREEETGGRRSHGQLMTAQTRLSPDFRSHVLKHPLPPLHTDDPNVSRSGIFHLLSPSTAKIKVATTANAADPEIPYG